MPGSCIVLCEASTKMARISPSREQGGRELRSRGVVYLLVGIGTSSLGAIVGALTSAYCGTASCASLGLTRYRPAAMLALPPLALTLSAATLDRPAWPPLPPP